MDHTETTRPYACVGIDVGSTALKAVVLDDRGAIALRFLRPTGWSSVQTAADLKQALLARGCDPDSLPCVATGYGRGAVGYASRTVTEITCHARGAAALFGREDLTVIDIGGQDTKIIRLAGGAVADFSMNDKCSAGTGRFLEVMANTLALQPEQLLELAEQGGGVTISSMCTVFAESEVVGLIGRGERRENIADAVTASIVTKVAAQVRQLGSPAPWVCLTGGLCQARALLRRLERELGCPILSHPDARYAGALGAALCARR